MSAPKIIATIRGGTLTAVHSDQPIEVLLLDYDDLQASGGLVPRTYDYPVVIYTPKEQLDLLNEAEAELCENEECDECGEVDCTCDDGECEYLIVTDTPNKRLFWHVKTGWMQNRNEASIYSQEERDAYPLPVGGEWRDI